MPIDASVIASSSACIKRYTSACLATNQAGGSCSFDVGVLHTLSIQQAWLDF
jgi:hypothetical protein